MGLELSFQTMGLELSFQSMDGEAINSTGDMFGKIQKLNETDIIRKLISKGHKIDVTSEDVESKKNVERHDDTTLQNISNRI